MPPNGFWSDIGNCEEYLSWLGKKLGFTSQPDWYRGRRADFRENCGRAFLKRFGNAYQGLKVVYPDYDWLPWMFENVPVGFWDDASNRHWYLRWLGKTLKYNDVSRWQELNSNAIRENHGGSLLQRYSIPVIQAEGARASNADMNKSWLLAYSMVRLSQRKRIAIEPSAVNQRQILFWSTCLLSHHIDAANTNDGNHCLKGNF